MVGEDSLFYQCVECCARMSGDEVKGDNFKCSLSNLDQNAEW